MLTLSTAMVEIGMYVAVLDRPWIGTPFIFQSFIISNEEHIRQLRKFCRTVVINIDKSDPGLRKKLLWYKMKYAEPEEQKKEPAVDAWQHVALPRDEYDEKQLHSDLGIAYQIYENTTNSLHKMLDNFRHNKSISPVELKTCVYGVIDGVVYRPEAMTLFSNLKSKQQDTVHHSLNVCILSLLFGRHLRLDDQQLSDLGYAALLHDVGDIKISKEILGKHRRGLNPEEKKEMQMHTKYGVEILLNTPNIPEMVVKVARSHHERVDGNGYPDGLKRDEIDYFAKLVSIVDAYEIVTNHPAAESHVSALVGLKSIYMMRDKFFDKELVEEFMKCLGAYPIGSLVKLNNGDIAIVICNRPSKHLLPVVMVVKNKEGILQQPRVINLEHFKEPIGLSKLHIIKAVDPDAEKINLSDYIIKKERIA